MKDDVDAGEKVLKQQKQLFLCEKNQFITLGSP